MLAPTPLTGAADLVIAPGDRTEAAVVVSADPGQVSGPQHLMFPGLFNECWLDVNGRLVAHRGFSEPWWRNDYRFEWDVDVGGKLAAGKNTLTLRGHCPYHFGGMFFRPFLHREVKK